MAITPGNSGAVKSLPVWLIRRTLISTVSKLDAHGLANPKSLPPYLVRVRVPLRASRVLQAVTKSAGRFVAVPEARILPGRDSLARLGFYVEPTSALVWAALEDGLSQLPEPVVVVLTGSGYKVGN